MSNVNRVIRACGLMIAAGCSHGSDAPTGPDAHVPARTIRATGFQHRYAAHGETMTPIGDAINAVSIRDAAGNFHPSSFPGTTQGVFTIEVDDGLVYLDLRGDFAANHEYIVGPADEVDAGSLVAGRGLQPGPGAPLSFGGDGLLPWRTDDQLVMTCPDIETTRFLGVGTSLVQQGATTFGPTVFDTLPMLLSAAKGDELWILQQRKDTVDGVTYQHYERALHQAAIEQSAGTTADTSGTFTAPSAEQLDLDIRISQFAAAAGAPADKLGATVDVVYQSFGMPRTFGTVGEHRVLTFVDLSKITQDKVISLPYGNPFPASFATFVELQASSPQKDYALPGTLPLLLGGGLSLEAPIAEAEAAPIVPRIGQVHDLLVDGAPASAAHASQAPTLAWQPPTLGTATAYVVDVFGLSVEQGSSFTRLDDVARLFTTEASVQVPPGVLKAGGTFFYEVTALSGGIDVKAAPHRVTGAYGASRTLSDPFKL
jgi:hypothetical protein